MSDKLDRRTMLTGAAFASVLALPVGANAGSRGTIGWEEPDPIFAAIEVHRKAFLECECCGIKENVARLSDIENDALCDLLEVTPATLAGVVALSRYAAELTALLTAPVGTGVSIPMTRRGQWSGRITSTAKLQMQFCISSGAQP